jgi:hypothetical protein
MQDDDGDTPLRFACRWVVSIDIMRQMIHLYPKALRISNGDGKTPLHGGCFIPRLEKLELLIDHCPESCLVLNNQHESPYDRVGLMRAPAPESVALLRAATTNAFIAFLVCARQSVVLVPVTPTMMTHIRQVLPGLFEEGLSVSYMNSNEAIRQALNHESLKTLLQNDDLQTLLKEEDCQDLIRGVYRMVQAGSNHHVYIMESVSKHQTLCIYTCGATQLFVTARRAALHSSKFRRLQNRIPKRWPSMMLHKLKPTETTTTLYQRESERRLTIFAISSAGSISCYQSIDWYCHTCFQILICCW